MLQLASLEVVPPPKTLGTGPHLVVTVCLLVQKVEDPVELWSIASRACSKRYLLMMAKLWHRASVPEDRIAMDSYVLHAPQDLPDQAAGPVEEALAVQPTQ